ncbi:beta-lactamase/transpeptidase-like protein [Calocera cornea HHB12733]|uniref:Beta-lactamase/transpeptidase-like protein n=1 Tax=Calocera cornea HHB12733 TaxID=1353952 RepID=A0A165EYU5_9BASI|nr:beta-lactamase/transpeptidase-like protein [Calocera cornea HHB12733]
MLWDTVLSWLTRLTVATQLQLQLQRPHFPHWQPLSTTGPVPALSLPHGVLGNLSELFGAVAREFKIPGMSLALVYAERDAPEFYNFGVRAEDGDPASEDTLYCIASNSKAFTAIALGILMDDFAQGRNVTPLPESVGKLDWTTKAVDLLPGEWKLKDEWASEKTSLIDMLSHVTGLPRHEFSYALGESIREQVERLRYLQPTYEFREKFQYNNQMYGAASYIVSKYSKQSYMSFVQDRIFKPLGMDASTYFPEIAFTSGKLAETWVNTAGPLFNETRRVPYFLEDWSEVNVGLNAGPGGVISSTKDLTHWIRTLLCDGKNPWSGEQVVPKQVLDTVTTGHSIQMVRGMFPELSPQVYGAGWERWAYAGHEMVSHAGSVPGFSSVITMLPNDGVGIIALSNGYELGSILLALTGRIIEELFDLPNLDWPGRLRNASAVDLPPQVDLDLSQEANSAMPISAFVGAYENPGYYGDLVLCSWPSEGGSDCEKVLEDYSLVDPEFEAKKATTLYAFWRRLFLSHVKLEQVDGTLFAIKADSLYVEGYGDDTSPFFVRRNPEGGAVAEFAVKDGAVTGVGAWGLAAGPRERIPGQPEESSEVWFRKIK